MKRYVCGEKQEIVLDGKGKRLDGEDRVFARVTKCCRTCNRKNASPFNVLEIYLHCLTTSLEER